MRLLLILALLMSALGPARASGATTLEVDGKTYRLDGIDAPETDQSCIGAEGELYPCGRKAAEELRKFIGGRTVRCEDLGEDRASPDRRMGRCAVEGTDLQGWLVREGWALSLERSPKGRFKTDEDDAKAGHFGLWKGCFAAPRDFRRWKRTAALLGASCPPDARDRLFPDEAAMPESCNIKAHYALRAWPYRGIYHLPGCRSFRTTKAKRWFCSEEEAREAQFRKAYTCGWWW